VERIIHLVNDMLDISRVSTGRLSLNIEKISLDKLVYDVIDRLRSFMELANCEVKVELDKDTFSMCDPFRIEQVITNLLTNAAKYAPESLVEISLSKEKGFAVIRVRDHGEGISEENQKRIFERFERAVSSNSVSGLGLGLYISREIIELHHGSIEVKSQMGDGSTFTVRLPLAQ
jgi:signal transduction histidine kinase